MTEWMKCIVPDDTIKILLATDNHIGYLERDPVRGQDAINTFEEILQLAVKHEVPLTHPNTSGDLRCSISSLTFPMYRSILYCSRATCFMITSQVERAYIEPPRFLGNIQWAIDLLLSSF